MPTLSAIRQEMLALEPRVLGRVFTPSSITTTTVVVSELATGTVGSGKYAQRFILRPTAANQPADRLRVVTATGFASSTGTLTHAGANYADTTVGTEVIELHEFDPKELDLAIDVGLRRIRRIDCARFQLRSDGRYPLAGYSWLEGQADLVVRFGRSTSPVLTDNRHFDRWGVVHTDGTLRPDSWDLAGSGGTFVRSTTARRGQYALSATRAGTDLVISQTFPAVFSDAPDDDLRGDTIQAVAVARSTEASSVRVRIEQLDGTGNVLTTTNGNYHAGDDTWRELTAEAVISTACEQIKVSIRVEVNEAALIDEGYAAFGEQQVDSTRRDDAAVEWLQRPYDYTQNPLTWQGPRGKGQQLVMESRRPYPGFDATRLAAGTADSDTTDCPLALAAHKALAVFFAGRATENARMAKLADRYAALADQLQQGHLYEPVQATVAPGANMLSSRVPYGRRMAVR